MRKRLTSLFLALLLTLSSGVAVYAKEGQKSEDKKIQSLMDRNILQGDEKGDLALDRTIKRSEMLKIVVYGLGMEDKAKELAGKPGPFPDVKTDHWANGIISLSKELTMDNGVPLISGYPDGQFKPEKEISGAEMATILVNLAKKDLKDQEPNTAKWPDSYIKWAEEEGILLAEYGVTKENASQPLKRDIAFKMFYNALEKSTQKEMADPEKVAVAKTRLEKYLNSLKPEVLEEEGIKLASNEKGITDFLQAFDSARDLLKKENDTFSLKDLEDLEKMPSYMDGDKLVKGSLRKLSRNILVDFQLQGERNELNPHNQKKYVSIEGPGSEILVKSSLKNLKQTGDRRLYLNYVKEADFTSAEVDASSSATPKYKKQVLPIEDYTVTDLGDGSYRIKINTLPEDTKLLKVIIKVAVADVTNVENADLVIVKGK